MNGSVREVAAYVNNTFESLLCKKSDWLPNNDLILSLSLSLLKSLIYLLKWAEVNMIYKGVIY